ncbi:hypothetical protein HDV04_006081 [Boothiomyces sp. JEL0838]|nr:hypothetical protein HDV04_006081 [Boothiomyces sp. JEL0838]
MAIVLRLINGSVNGIVGVCKTYLSEITDSTNQAKGFAFLGVMRGLGMIVGPIVGGFLCLPAEKYPQIFPKGSLFDMFPYALPCVVGWGIAMIGTLVGFFVLEETNQAAIASNKRAFFYTWFINRQEAAPLLQDQVDDSTTEIDAEPRLSIWQLACMPRVYYSFILYTLTSFIYIQYDELFALWSRLPVSEGGLNFSSSDQGAAFAIGGFMLFFYQIFLFAPIEKALGCLKTFQTGLLLSLPAFIILPLIGKYGMLHEGRVEYLMWTLVGVCNILRTVGGVQAFTSTFIMVSNSVTSNYRGEINGSAQSLGSIGRMLGPIFAGTLFTWSLESNLPYPFDYHFVFNLLAVIVFLGYLISLRMPKDIDNRLEED